MEIQEMKPTARFDANLANGQTFECEIEFMPIGFDTMDYVKSGEDEKRIVMNKSDIFKGMLIEKMVSWNLTNEKTKEAIPCTKKNRELYLPMIIGEMIKDGGGILGIMIVTFASDPANFLKN